MIADASTSLHQPPACSAPYEEYVLYFYEQNSTIESSLVWTQRYEKCFQQITVNLIQMGRN
jgi:hypothetical protein